MSALAQCAGAVTLHNAYRFSDLEDKRRKWLVFLKDKQHGSLFSPGAENTVYVRLVCWGVGCGRFPVFASKSHLWKKQQCAAG